MNVICSNCQTEIDVSGVKAGGVALCPACDAEMTLPPPAEPPPFPKTVKAAPSPLNLLPKGGTSVQATLGGCALFFLLVDIFERSPTHGLSISLVTAAFLVTGAQILDRLNRILRELVMARIDRDQTAANK